jgi:hypothetical protein
MAAKGKKIYETSATGLGFLACIGILIFQSHQMIISPTSDPLAPTIQTPVATETQSNTAAIASHSAAPSYKSVANKRTPQKIANVQATSLPNPTFKVASGETYPLRTYKTLATNDPYGSQWWTTGTGLDAAWSVGAGSRQTTVAVIDTGFALSHEELASRWATNSGEQGTTTSENPSQRNCTDRSLALNASCNLIDDDYDGVVDNESGGTTVQNPSHLNCMDRSVALNKSCNLVDDDGNGYVDDVTGWDFANSDASVQAGQTKPSGSSTEHGTEVSGILAATGNNGKGLAGVNWATKILPLQAINDDGYGNTLTVGEAIYYAADRGVDVISLSLGSTGDDPYTRQAVQYALDKGSIVVAASGNDGCNCMLYPANYPEVIAVGAQNSSNQRSSFSSYGSNLDLVAPGEDMITSTWSPSNQTSAYVGGVAGTSFATPYVSGLLSLARSHQPDATWGELTNALLSSASHSGLSNASPYSAYIGSGYARAGTYLTRVTTASQPGMRYGLAPLSQVGTLGSMRAFDCAPTGDFPTAPLYEITSGSSVFYTVDPLEEIRAAAEGATVRSIGRSCVGLPGDTPATSRTINLLSEIGNLSTKY